MGNSSSSNAEEEIINANAERWIEVFSILDRKQNDQAVRFAGALLARKINPPPAVLDRYLMDYQQKFPLQYTKDIIAATEKDESYIYSVTATSVLLSQTDINVTFAKNKFVLDGICAFILCTNTHLWAMEQLINDAADNKTTWDQVEILLVGLSLLGRPMHDQLMMCIEQLIKKLQLIDIEHNQAYQRALHLCVVRHEWLMVSALLDGDVLLTRSAFCEIRFQQSAAKQFPLEKNDINVSDALTAVNKLADLIKWEDCLNNDWPAPLHARKNITNVETPIVLEKNTEYYVATSAFFDTTLTETENKILEQKHIHAAEYGVWDLTLSQENQIMGKQDLADFINQKKFVTKNCRINNLATITGKVLHFDDVCIKPVDDLHTIADDNIFSELPNEFKNPPPALVWFWIRTRDDYVLRDISLVMDYYVSIFTKDTNILQLKKQFIVNNQFHNLMTYLSHKPDTPHEPILKLLDQYKLQPGEAFALPWLNNTNNTKVNNNRIKTKSVFSRSKDNRPLKGRATKVDENKDEDVFMNYNLDDIPELEASKPATKLETTTPQKIEYTIDDFHLLLPFVQPPNTLITSQLSQLSAEQKELDRHTYTVAPLQLWETMFMTDIKRSGFRNPVMLYCFVYVHKLSKICCTETKDLLAKQIFAGATNFQYMFSDENKELDLLCMPVDLNTKSFAMAANELLDTLLDSSEDYRVNSKHCKWIHMGDSVLLIVQVDKAIDSPNFKVQFFTESGKSRRYTKIGLDLLKLYSLTEFSGSLNFLSSLCDPPGPGQKFVTFSFWRGDSGSGFNNGSGSTKLLLTNKLWCTIHGFADIAGIAGAASTAGAGAIKMTEQKIVDTTHSCWVRMPRDRILRVQKLDRPSDELEVLDLEVMMEKMARGGKELTLLQVEVFETLFYSPECLKLLLSK